MFAYQGHHIIENVRPVFRVFVPLILYFVIMWTSAFALVYYLTRRENAKNSGPKEFGYEMAVVQAFTAGSNNFVSAGLLLSRSHLDRLTVIFFFKLSLTRNWQSLLPSLSSG